MPEIISRSIHYHNKWLINSLLILLLSQFGYGQISISHPINKAVYQRNLDNKADIMISGSYDYDIVTSIQVRLRDYNTNTVPEGFSWKIIEINPTKGLYQGMLENVPGGWYKLDVRAVKSGVVLGTAKLSRVGVGEVFAIAGQSNAQGWHVGGHWQGADADDERVVAFDNGMYCGNIPMAFPTFTEIKETTEIAPNGKAAWLWGILGKHLADSLDVPISFFNYGAAGSSSKNWVESSRGISTIHPFLPGQIFCSHTDDNDGRSYGLYEPYNNFKRGLNYYNSMFGARAVLWHQGESDNFEQVSKNTHKNNLKSIIDSSRSNYNDNLPWMISRASYFISPPYSNGIYTPVVNAQTEILNERPKMFEGPNTDNINNTSYYGSRDGIDLHFSNPMGFQMVAADWKDWLTTSNFKNNATPIAANHPPEIIASITNDNKIKLSAPSGYAKYKWIRTDVSGNHNYEGTVSEGSSRSITKSVGGTYRCWVVDDKGNLQVSIPVNTNKVMGLTTNGSSCASHIYLSDLKYHEAENNLGPIEIDQTAGQEADGDGVPIKLKMFGFEKGIGVHGQSKISYRLPEDSYSKFQVNIGVPDNVAENCLSGGVYFKVVVDRDTLYISDLVKRNSDFISIDIDIFGKKELSLITEEASFSECNQAVWADAVLKCSDIDDESPTAPTALAASDTLSRCITYNWDASSDNIGVSGYEIFMDGDLQDTISGSTLTHSLTDLLSEVEYVIAVRTFDSAGNYSNFTFDTLNLPKLEIAYFGNDKICASASYLPTNISIPGGEFSKESGPAAILDKSTGSFYSEIAGQFEIKYEIGLDNPVCYDSKVVTVVTTSPPETPTLTSNTIIANKGTEIILEVTGGCESGSTISWNFSENNINPITITPTDTSIYFAKCIKSACIVKSNVVEVKILDDCYDILTLIDPNDNLSNISNPLRFNASGRIKASNLISPSAKVDYKSASSIILEPGFSVVPGVVFKAEIKNCP